MDSSGVISFGGFVLNRTRGCLQNKTGAELFLRPKSYRVLELLAERRGELVGKDELVRMAWPDMCASDDSLAHCVSDIRRALGPQGVKLLRTAPRRGYILIASRPEPSAQARTSKHHLRARTAAMAAALMLIVGGALRMAPRGAPDAMQPGAVTRGIG